MSEPARKKVKTEETHVTLEEKEKEIVRKEFNIFKKDKIEEVKWNIIKRDHLDVCFKQIFSPAKSR